VSGGSLRSTHSVSCAYSATVNNAAACVIAAAVRWHPAEQDININDNEWSGAANPSHVHRSSRGTGKCLYTDK